MSATTAAPRSASVASRGSETIDQPTDPLAAIRYTHQAEKLSHTIQDTESVGGGMAVKAEYITPQDPIVITADGGRLPGVPLSEAAKLNSLRDQLSTHNDEHLTPDDARLTAREKQVLQNDMNGALQHSPDHAKTGKGVKVGDEKGHSLQKSGEGSLRKSMPPSRTNPLFPPLPLYGPSSFQRDVQCLLFRTTSFFLSTTFLGVIVLGSVFTSILPGLNSLWYRWTFRDPDKKRPFYEEELRRAKVRKEEEGRWKKRQLRSRSPSRVEDAETEEFVPTEGGSDPIICNVGYYARRVGLDVEFLKVQTEDGFIIELWHVYDPKEYTPMTPSQRAHRGPDIFLDSPPSQSPKAQTSKKPKYPILMIHGLLQSSGAYCTNDDNSLAFYLCKSGYDVWLGNNRCGFKPEHTLLSYSDPRMWAWNIRQMGVMDLSALVSRVLSETTFAKLGLICHSQGTTQTFVALAKEQRPELGEKISVFCALAPAAYAGPLIGKFYFKFMRLISPAFFRVCFGIHSFIPLMMTMHGCIPGKLYGAMGYRVFNFLFNWSDDRWDRGVRDRCFIFAPTYVSAEAMRWWLGRECFARHRCILATREESQQEDVEDEEEEYYKKSEQENERSCGDTGRRGSVVREKHKRKSRGSTAWYDERVPPMALWIAGTDDLVDGRRLLRRFQNGREPHVKLVHAKVIEEYEHLDVIWAMDSIEQVGSEVKEVLWKTCECRDEVRTPRGCEDVGVWKPESPYAASVDGKEAGVERGGSGDGSDDQSSSAEETMDESRSSRRTSDARAGLWRKSEE